MDGSEKSSSTMCQPSSQSKKSSYNEERDSDKPPAHQLQGPQFLVTPVGFVLKKKTLTCSLPTVREVSFFIGANGAGKSTILRIPSGRHPTSSTVL
jgi:ABC-type molybdenum transport system ATPase subunit/photorepair protein PhrA